MRLHLTVRAASVLAVGILLACSASDAQAASDTVVLAGQAPTPEELIAYRARGVELVVDLRTPAEGTVSEAFEVAALGMSYVNMPVGATPVDDAFVARLGSRLDALSAARSSERPTMVLLHCASGNRAGEVLTRYLMMEGADVEEALRAGREAGLRPEREARLEFR